MEYRFYYDKDENYLYIENLKFFNERESVKYAKSRLRMYANLFIRDERKFLINEKSSCKMCGSAHKLQLDHIMPITKGGKNLRSNLQILCSSCNNKKRNKWTAGLSCTDK